MFALLESVWNFRQNPWHYPPHFRHVATLSWEIKNFNFLQICNKTNNRLWQYQILC